MECKGGQVLLETSGWSWAAFSGEGGSEKRCRRGPLAPGLSWGVKPGPPPYTSALEVHRPGLRKI